MRLAKTSVGVLLGLGIAPFLVGAAKAQIQCTLSGPTGRATVDARTCTREDSKAIALAQAQAMADQQVRCPVLTGPAVNAICRKHGLKPALGQFWPRPITPPKGYYQASYTFPTQCQAFRKVSEVVYWTPGTPCPIWHAKVQVMKACGVLCQR
ncbi:MAG: hypothetical protein WCE79_15580 [Xanthobacteraceae bacterium]